MRLVDVLSDSLRAIQIQMAALSAPHEPADIQIAIPWRAFSLVREELRRLHVGSLDSVIAYDEEWEFALNLPLGRVTVRSVGEPSTIQWVEGPPMGERFTHPAVIAIPEETP